MLRMAGNAPTLAMPVAAVFSDESRDFVNEEALIFIFGVVVKNGNLLWVFSCDSPLLFMGDGTLHEESERGGESFM